LGSLGIKEPLSSSPPMLDVFLFITGFKFRCSIIGVPAGDLLAAIAGAFI